MLGANMTLPPAPRRLALALGIAVLAGGCQVTETSVLTQAFLAPELPDRPRTIYCYRTIGVADCHARPVPPDEQSRLIEYQGLPPALIATDRGKPPVAAGFTSPSVL